MLLSQKTCIKIINQKQKTKHYKKTNIKSNHKIQKTTVNSLSVPCDDDVRLRPTTRPPFSKDPLAVFCLRPLPLRNAVLETHNYQYFMTLCASQCLKEALSALTLHCQPIGMTNQILRNSECVSKTLKTALTPKNDNYDVTNAQNANANV